MSLLLGAWSVKVQLGWFEISVVRLLDRFDCAPRALLADQFRPVEVVDRLSEGVIVRVADGSR